MFIPKPALKTLLLSGGQKSWGASVWVGVALCLLAVTGLPTGVAWGLATVQDCFTGDTCKVNDNTVFYTFKILGIDAPELDQPYGKEARRYTRNLLKSHRIQLKCTTGFLKTKVCKIDMDGQDVASLIVQEGFAWDKPEESFGKYRRYQHEAMEANRGLWSDDTKAILSPFCWREPSSEQCNDPQFMP